MLLAHALEHTEQLRPLLREIWRVLNPSGRVIVVVPNRRGIWARIDSTPFGHGHPYTAGQLSRLLRDNQFTPLATRSALYTPPVFSRLYLTSAGAWERLGERWFERFAGVVLVEAGKQLYAPTAVRRVQRRRPAYLPMPAPARERPLDEGLAPPQQEQALLAEQVGEEARRAQAARPAAPVEHHALLDDDVRGRYRARRNPRSCRDGCSASRTRRCRRNRSPASCRRRAA